MEDNIALDELSDEESRALMQKFSDLETVVSDGSRIVASFANRSDDQQRLYAAMEHCRKQQKVNELTYDLLVLMNNYFGKH